MPKSKVQTSSPVEGTITSPSPVKLSEATQQRLMAQLSQGTLKECTAPSCKVLFTPTGTSTVCATCLVKPKPAQTPKKTKTRAICEEARCDRPATARSKYCSKYCMDRSYRARRKVEIQRIAAEAKTTEDARVAEALRNPTAPVVDPVEETARGVIREKLKDRLGETPLTDLTDKIDLDAFIKEATVTTETDTPKEAETVIRTKGNYVGTEGGPCHMPGCTGTFSLKHNSNSGQPFYGCSRYWRRNRKDGSKQCKGTARVGAPSAADTTPQGTQPANQDVKDILAVVTSCVAGLNELRKELAELHSDVRTLERMATTNERRLNGVMRTVDNMDTRAAETQEAMAKLSKEMGV